MAVSYTTASARDAARERARVVVDPWHAALAGVSLLACALVLLTYSRITGTRALAAFPASAAGSISSRTVINLNAVASAADLEPAFAGAFAADADRRLAAAAVFATVIQADGGRRVLTDVRVVQRARIDAQTIVRTSGATEYRSRLDDQRARAAAAGHAAPPTVAAVSSADFAQIKPALAVRTIPDVRNSVLLWLIVYVVSFHAVALFWRFTGKSGGRVLLVAAHALTAAGFSAMLSRTDPIRDALLFPRYVEGIVLGLLVMALLSRVNLRLAVVRHLSFLPLAGAVLLSIALLTFGSGPAGSHARVNLGPFQPIEAIRILLALFFAGYFARTWELLRAVRADAVGSMAVPGWLHLPKPRYALPVVTGVALALALFYLQRDLGPALMLSVVFLAAYGIARGRAGMVVAGAGLLAAGFYLGYHLGISATLAERVRMWEAPWNNGVRGGNQIAHALWAMATGGVFGTGAGLGDTGYIPAGATDLVLAALGEEFGWVGLLVVAALYVILIGRALRIARHASSDYGFFLATTLALFIAVPVLLMAAGTMGVVPLTGVVTPFLSYGGSAMLANFAALGLLTAIASDAAPSADLAAFARPMRYLSVGLSAAAVALVIVAARIDVLQADAIVVRPHLGLQADGVRRFQDNPRILDIARSIPRGTVVDRAGLPLATSDRAVLRKAAQPFASAGVSIDPSCADAGGRCYPLGGRAFHLLGDARTRVNWSASNTAFVERDEEAQLRGFDDHAAVVPVLAADGSEATALRRDYRELVPLLRHRYDRDDPAVVAAMNADRRLRLTIDGRLQARVAAILAAYARKSASGHGAAVVIDPANGDLLASVSYPWPADGASTGVAPDTDPEALLDRARFGLYPPGSTFKLVTAAAALRRDPGAEGQTFTCSRLGDDRVGAKIPGYTRPVRDDEKDRVAHGTLDMHRALVVSCNAYFAQLAVRLGTQSLIDTAQCVEIPLARGNSAARIRDTLPQIGYGQGDVLASPLRIARIVGAIASDGQLRDTRIDAAAPQAATRPFVTPSVAALLARDMRDVVLDGTGRALRGSSVAIAGKTGTAEVAGQPSHSWFAGFAPYGKAAHRVAVVVILENAGYGAAGAAPAAGEIVAAAAQLGLAR